MSVFEPEFILPRVVFASKTDVVPHNSVPLLDKPSFDEQSVSDFTAKNPFCKVESPPSGLDLIKNVSHVMFAID